MGDNSQQIEGKPNHMGVSQNGISVPTVMLLKIPLVGIDGCSEKKLGAPKMVGLLP